MGRVLPSPRFLPAVVLIAPYMLYLAASLPHGFALVLMPWRSWSTGESLAGDTPLAWKWVVLAFKSIFHLLRRLYQQKTVSWAKRINYTEKKPILPL